MESKKRNLKGILKGSFTALITIMLLIIIGFVLNIRVNESYYNIDGMYKSEKIDVLFVGNSHSLAAFQCDVFDENTGVFSYNLSTTSQSLKSGELLVRESVKNHDIDVIFVETFSMIYPSRKDFLYTKAKESDMSAIRSLKSSINKLDGIISQKGMRNIFDGFLPVFKYHANWKKPEKWNLKLWDVKSTLESYDKYNSNHYKGTRYIPYILTQDQLSGYDEYSYEFNVEVLMNLNKKYWDNIIDICEENDVTVVFVTAPWLDKFVETTNYNKVDSLFKDYFKSKGITYLDMNSVDLGLDFQDFAKEDPNPNQHLNIIGGKKATEYIASYYNQNLVE